MITPFLSVGVAILYFGWLWHDRTAASAKAAARYPQVRSIRLRLRRSRSRVPPLAGVRTPRNSILANAPKHNQEKHYDKNPQTLRAAGRLRSMP